MSREECDALLRRNTLGRMGFSFQDQVDIQPLNYVFRDPWLFGRTSEGAKLVTLRHNRWVAFQVDEIRDDWNWDSVVVRGGIHVLGEGGGAEDRRLHEVARKALREVIPELDRYDPAPHRDVIFGLAPHEIVGRSARLVEIEDPG